MSAIPSSSTLTILVQLLAFDTTSRESNLALIDWVADYLDGYGIHSTLTFSDDRHKANLYATIGDSSLPAIILSGHTDVVPVDGQTWQYPPFAATKTDDRIYGRGSADMKGFVACVLAMVPAWAALAQTQHWTRSLGIALSYDEEVGCLGVGRLIADLQARQVPVAGCIIGEPTNMRPVIAHKGIAHYRCHVQGRAAHSSLTPQGVNAIEYAARLITHIRKLADTEASFGNRHPLYDVPFTTLQTGLISGGNAANIVPKSCEFVFEVRWLPGDAHERFVSSVRDYASSLQQEMREIAPEAEISFEQLVNCPPFQSEEGGEIREHVAALCGCHGGDAVAYTTEAGRFHEAGIACVVCGPGSIVQAHRPDEFVELDQLAACEAWLSALQARLVAEE
ncbi:acetylornithine deacetylase [Vogesella oryzae]|uniref:acetylornithine deacetylase n=1 Tax=Vogesella oryzae TaxID=1735285 RepID=UPI00158343F0|nr:acetylornithine deacetylase [Vogesella oryzae]